MSAYLDYLKKSLLANEGPSTIVQPRPAPQIDPTALYNLFLASRAIQPGAGPVQTPRVTPGSPTGKAAVSTPLPDPRTVSPGGGVPPQSASTNAELVARGPGYGSQAARVNGTNRETPAGWVDPRTLVPAQPQVNPNMVIPGNIEGASMANSFVAADAMDMSSVPFFRGIANAVTDPNKTAEAVMSTVGNAISAVPGGERVLEELQRPYNWNAGNIGQSAYEKANGQQSGNQAVGGVNLNPTYYLIEPWATNPQNKDAINAAYTVGLDLNGDGTVDVKGGNAVTMAWMASEHPGFLDQLVVQLGLDPLFYVPIAGELAGGARADVTAALESGTAGAKATTVLTALDKALAVTQSGADIANRAANLPFEIPFMAAKGAAGIARRIPFLRGATDAVEGAVRTAADISPSAKMANEHSAARDFADEVQAAKAPVDVAPPAEAKPILALTSGTDAIPMGSGADRVTQTAIDGAPGWTIGEDFRVKSVPDRGYVLEGKVADGSYAEAGVFATSDEAITAGRQLSGSDVILPDGTAALKHDRVTTPTEGMTAEERIAAIKRQEISQLDPVSGGTRLVDRSYDSALDRPEAAKAFDSAHAPLKESYLKADRQLQSAMDPIKVKIAETERRIQAVEAAIKDKAWGVAGGRQQTFALKQQLYAEKDALWTALKPKILEQITGGIEHTVNDIATAYAGAYHELPEIATTAHRKPVLNADGSVKLKADGSPVHVPFPQENYAYLMQRYVFEENGRTAGKILGVLKGHKDIVGHPNTDSLIARLIDARDSLETIRETVNRGTIPMRIDAEGNVYELPRPISQPSGDASSAIPDTSIEPPKEPGMYMQTRYQAMPSETVAPNVDRPITLDDLLDDLVNQGYISEQAGAFGKRTVSRGTYERKVGGAWKEITPAQAKRALKGELPTGPFDNGTIRYTEEPVTATRLLQETIDAMPDAPTADITAAFADRWMRMTGSTIPPRMPVDSFVKASRFKQTVKKVSAATRSAAIHNATNSIRAILSDEASDTFRMALEGHGVVPGKSIVDYLTKSAGGKTSIELLEERFGRKVPSRIKEQHVGRTEVDSAGRSPTSILVGGDNPETFRAKIANIVTGPFDSRLAARSRQELDNVRRAAVFESSIRQQESAAVRDFTKRGSALAEANGIDARVYRAYVADLGQEFSVEDIRATARELATDAGLSAEAATEFSKTMAHDWSSTLGRMWKIADDEQARVLFSYERTNLDQALGNVIFYHYWMSRAIPAYARLAVRNPWLAAMWVRGWNDMSRRAERDGLPDSLRGYIQAMGSLDGWYGSISPWNVLMPVADMMPDVQKQGLYEKVTQFFAVSPIVSMAASVIGLSNDAVDPFSTYATRNMAMAIVNKIRAETGRPNVLPDAYSTLLTKAYQAANDIVAHTGIPPTNRKVFTDPNTYTLRDIREVVATKLAEQTGIPIEQWTSVQWNQWLSAVADGEAGIDNPLYKEAYQEWADAKLNGRLLNSVIPGGMRTRYGPGDELLGPYSGLTEGQQTEKEMVNSGSNEDAKLDIVNRQWETIGTEFQRTLAEGWAELAYGERYGQEIPGYYTVDVGGKTYRMQDIARMTQEQRYALADEWVKQYGGTDDLKAYRAERDAFKAEHPEFGAYQEYRSTAFDYEGGLHQFRLDREAGNPNFKRAVADRREYYKSKGVSASVIEDELDAWAVTLDGYKAASGIKNSLYDADPISTGDQSTYASLIRSGDGGGGSRSGSGTGSTTAGTLQKQITKYTQDMAVLTSVMQAYGLDPAALQSNDPYMMQALRNEFGDLIPTKPALLQQYEAWVKVQPKGADTSVDAFGLYLDNYVSETKANYLEALTNAAA